VFPFLLRKGFSLDVRLVSLCHVCFLTSLLEGLRLDVRLISLCHVCFPTSLLEGLRLDVRLVSLCHVCFPTSLPKISLNIISQICEHMIGEYSLGYYCARHVLNGVGF
jgi:E3 ubiquitin-protein ligase DOA10